MNKWIVNSFVAAVAVAVAVAAGSAGWAAGAGRTLTLKIGDPAPEYKVETWLKGTPVPRLEPGHIYLLEFWATRCAPCMAALPHLKALSEQYQGKVTFVAIGQPYEWETVDSVRQFVRKKGDLMPYAVALDALPGKGKQMYDSWGPPAGFSGVPVTFVVDGSGKVAWTGMPTHVDQPLQQIVAGAYDMKAARRQQEADHETALAELNQKEWFQTALSEKKYAEVAQRVDRLVARNPGIEPEIFHFKMRALLHTNAEEAVEYMRLLPPALQGGAAEIIAAQGGELSKSAYQSVAEYLEKEVKNNPEAHVVTWQMLADTQHRLGNLDRAIEVLQVTVEKARALGNDGFFKEFTAQLEATLKEYQAEKAAQGGHRQAPG